MSSQTATVGGGVVSAGVSGNCLSRAIKNTADKSLHFFVGLAVLFALWGIGIYFVALNPSSSQFGVFGAFAAVMSVPVLGVLGMIGLAVSRCGLGVGWGLGLGIVFG